MSMQCQCRHSNPIRIIITPSLSFPLPLPFHSLCPSPFIPFAPPLSFPLPLPFHSLCPSPFIPFAPPLSFPLPLPFHSLCPSPFIPFAPPLSFPLPLPFHSLCPSPFIPFAPPLSFPPFLCSWRGNVTLVTTLWSLSLWTTTLTLRTPTSRPSRTLTPTACARTSTTSSLWWPMTPSQRATVLWCTRQRACLCLARHSPLGRSLLTLLLLGTSY